MDCHKLFVRSYQCQKLFIQFWLVFVAVFLIQVTSSTSNTNAESVDPMFTDVIENITVPTGRNVKLACSVKNLGTYKVAWMHYDQSAILTVHNHVITRNPRISVTHDKHRTWFLHISNVQEEDRGRYMCQINTVNAKKQFGYLHVVVPPNIDDSASSSDVIVKEGANVTLTCKATGSPTPTIRWKRDDNSLISINKTLRVNEWESESLELTRISRLDMGGYLCIASNGVPPTVSKRIKVSVDFQPMLSIPHQLVGAPLGYSVTLECTTEAYPTSLNYWTREDGHMIHESRKYHAENSIGDQPYKTLMKLTINNIQHSDYGIYRCIAKNPHGETDGVIRLYTSLPPTTTVGTVPAESGQIKNNQVGYDVPIHHNNSLIPSIKTDLKSGSKYVPNNNMNEIDNTNQKSHLDVGGKGAGSAYDWPTMNEGNSGSSRTSCHFQVTLVLFWGLLQGFFSLR